MPETDRHDSISERLAEKSAKNPAAQRIRMRLVYADFWPTVKLAFLLGLTLAILTIIGAYLVHAAFMHGDVFDKANALMQDIAGAEAIDLDTIFSLPRVMTFAVVVASLNTIVITALGAIVAMLYNLSVMVTGGLLVGFTDH